MQGVTDASKLTPECRKVVQALVREERLVLIDLIEKRVDDLVREFGSESGALRTRLLYVAAGMQETVELIRSRLYSGS
jgi:hypothetical protein